MRSWTILITTVILVTFGHAAVYPWIPLAPWWVRAPDKDTPASVNIQQLGGSYVYSTAEGKAYHTLAPAAVIQPPVASVHVQAVPALTVQYLPTGQAILVPAAPVAEVSAPRSSAGDDPQQEDASESAPESSANEVGSEPEDAGDQGQPREPAPVTEQPEDNEAAESS